MSDLFYLKFNENDSICELHISMYKDQRKVLICETSLKDKDVSHNYYLINFDEINKISIQDNEFEDELGYKFGMIDGFKFLIIKYYVAEICTLKFPESNSSMIDFICILLKEVHKSPCSKPYTSIRIPGDELGAYRILVDK